jgi:REP element-mobilizing transposase RayT
MSRPIRIDLPFCLYHVMSRGNVGSLIFIDDKDRKKFHFYLGKYTELFSFRVHAYCLMDAHIHLLVESSNQSLSEYIRRLLTAYTVWFHRRHGTWGHLFAGRFKSLVVDKGSYLVAVSRYIHRNPVDAGLVKSAKDYPWSSMRAYLRSDVAPPFLFTGEILGWFRGDVKEYEKFVREGLEREIKPKILAQRFIGGENFTKRMHARLKTVGKSYAIAPPERMNIKKEEYKKEGFQKADDLLKSVCQFLGCNIKDMKNKRRKSGIWKTILMMTVSLLRERTTLSFRQIGEYCGFSGEHAQYIHRIAKRDKKVLRELIKIEKQANL